MWIVNLMLQDISILAAKTACLDNRLRMEKFFEVEILIGNQWAEDEDNLQQMCKNGSPMADG